jgi:hypothetical protein
MWKSVWHVESSLLLARAALFLAVLILGSLGVRFASQGLMTIATLMLSILVYRLRYKQ